MFQLLGVLLDQVRDRLGYPQRNQQAAIVRVHQLAHAVETNLVGDEVDRERAADFSAKYKEIGPAQAKILAYVVRECGTRAQVPQVELYERFDDVQTHLFYRLEQLRLIGFLNRRQSGTRGGQPDFDWSLSRKYRDEIG